ncbi:MAG: TonB-dependent hemoglobin/transferrin/lactoferrin family receptor [Acidobacteria bacterium]|nr:MAG: TonB-dependent hemoglobin/transferrin/lactoferrin family receptor [Acidobacteriota bacterium]
MHVTRLARRGRESIRSTTAARAALAAVLLSLLLTVPAATADDPPAAKHDGAPAPAAAGAASTPPATYAETVTVTATRSRQAIRDTPGQVDVVGRDEIEELGYANVADLVRYVPGVYVEGDPTRLGTSGFNVRGIGGNRVLTQIDGIPIAEQFDFGPLSVTQYSLDVDALESVEIMRSAGSALYGSDALGGVVALETRSPRSYLGDRSQALGLRLGYDDRAGEHSETLVYARGTERWQGSLLVAHRDGGALGNQGTIDSRDHTRTLPNPMDRRQDNALAKLSRSAGGGALIEATAEYFRGRTDTEALSARRPGSPFASGVLDADAFDVQNRLRLSVEHSLVLDRAAAATVLWRAYWQDADTEQTTREIRTPPQGRSLRHGLLVFDQRTAGVELEVRAALGSRGDSHLTYGLLYRIDRFDQLRDRSEAVLETGEAVPTTLIFPTKYFPQSDVSELGAYLQGELLFAGGRLRLIPGVRFDRYALDAEARDPIFLSGNPGTPEPADLADAALSPRLGLVVAASDAISLFANYARGFRAPPMSAVNNGFTNPAGGYRTLANSELEPETSDNFELGLRAAYRRGSFSITAFDNAYDGFIDTVFLGFNPIDFLIEFQPRNVEDVTIRGFELAGDLHLGRAWRLRAAYAFAEGRDQLRDEPLDSIQPPNLVAGFRFQRPGWRWGLETTVQLTAAKKAEDLPPGSSQFRTPGYATVDVAAWWSLSDRLTLQLSGWNLSDETYWQWSYARGRREGAPDLDRYTSPGRSFGLQARYRF